MSKEIILSYAEARKLAASFSILNCQAKKWPFRWIGHTAMIYRERMTDTVWVYESTQTGDANGVRLVLFSDWLRDYPGQVWLRRCSITDMKLAQHAQAALQRHIKLYRGKPYPNLKKAKGIMYLLRAAWDSVLFKKASTNKDTADWFFCSHLVADAYWLAKLVLRKKLLAYPDSVYIAAEFKPDDMRLEVFASWLRGLVKLSAEVRIK